MTGSATNEGIEMSIDALQRDMTHGDKTLVSQSHHAMILICRKYSSALRYLFISFHVGLFQPDFKGGIR